MRTTALTPAPTEQGHFLGRFNDQTPVVNVAAKLLVKEQQLVQNVLKHLTVEHVHSNAERRPH